MASAFDHIGFPTQRQAPPFLSPSEPGILDEDEFKFSSKSGHIPADGNEDDSPKEDNSEDESPTLALSPLDADKEEGDFGTTPFTFEVTRSGDLSESTTVDWAVADDLVISSVVDGRLLATPNDFQGAGFPEGSVTLAEGQESATITVPVRGDVMPELDGSLDTVDLFEVILEGASGGATIETARAGGRIQNDDPFGSSTPLGGDNFGANAETSGIPTMGGTAEAEPETTGAMVESGV